MKLLAIRGHIRWALLLAACVAGIAVWALWPAPLPLAAGEMTNSLKAADRPPSEEELIRAVLTAVDIVDAADGYRSLLKLVGSEGLPRLQRHASDSIAVQAAWMQIQLTVPAEEPARAVPRPDRDKLARFLVFLEGRARV